MEQLEIEQTNKKIELHNKFCFMKKEILLYRKSIPLYIPIFYAIISLVLFALPILILNTSHESKPFSEISLIQKNTKIL